MYLDTSVVVPLFTNEDATPLAKEWASTQRGVLAISEWISTEFASALALKLRTGSLSKRGLARATGHFDRTRRGFRTLSFEPRFFVEARNYIADHETSLRASDALHLAIAASVSAKLCTRDRRFAEAAAQLGHAVELI